MSTNVQSLCCKPENNIVIYVNYTSTKKITLQGWCLPFFLGGPLAQGGSYSLNVRDNLAVPTGRGTLPWGAMGCTGKAARTESREHTFSLWVTERDSKWWHPLVPRSCSPLFGVQPIQKCWLKMRTALGRHIIWHHCCQAWISNLPLVPGPIPSPVYSWGPFL